MSLLPGQTLLAGDDLAGAQVLVRVRAGDSADTWSQALTLLRSRGARGGLHILGIPRADDPLLTAAAATVAIEITKSPLPQDVLQLKEALARARGEHHDAELLIAVTERDKAALMSQGVEPYADAFLPPPRPLDDIAAAVTATDRGLWLLDADAIRARAQWLDLVRLQSWFVEGLAAVPDRAVRCGSVALSTFINPQTLDLVAHGTCQPGAAIATDTPGAPIDRLSIDDWTVIRVRAGSDTRFSEGISIAGARDLTVEEIVVRHQAFAARQAALIRTRISTGSLTVTFEAPGFPAPVTIASRTVMFVAADRSELQQQDIRVNGVAFHANGGIPRLPIIEPERAAAPPLAITLTDVYRYRLEGRATIRGHETYRVSFSPSDRKQPLYQGEVWIDARSFAMVRVAAAQTGLRGPITASEQVDDFEPDAGGRWLLWRSDIRQTYEGASVRTPIHRLLVLEAREVNPADFEARRQAAYASPDVMLRDTPGGFRYLRRERGATSPGHQVAPVPQLVVSGRAERIRTLAFGVIVDPNISQPLPFAGLSYVDFNLFGTGAQLNGFFGGSFGQLAFSVPSVRGSRWQVAGRAFGIVTSYNDRSFEQGREQYPRDIRQRPASTSVWLLRPISPRASLRVEYDWDYTRFGRADTTSPDFVVPANQVVHGLRLGLDVQRAGWQGSLWWNPARRAGWRPWGSVSCRGGAPVLEAGATALDSSCFRPGHASFQRFGASALRSRAWSPRVATRVEVAAMAGRDLDRFSRYAFGTFDNRLHGYPSALVRYDRGAVLRTALSVSAARMLRLDGFADTAEVHDPGFGRGFRNYTGFGAAAEAPAPFGTLLSVEWSYGLQGLDARGRKGTQVVRISGYKVF